MPSYCLKLIRPFFAAFLCLPAFCIAYVDDYSVETFYKDATYTHFVRSISETYSHDYSCHPANDKLITYAIHVLIKHPDFAPNLVNDFASFETCQQQVVCASLQGASFHNELRAINEQYHGACQVSMSTAVQNANNISFLSTIETFEDQKQQAANIAHCWAAYFATGDEKTIAKMVEYVKAFQGQYEHTQAISEIETRVMILAQHDPEFNNILVKHSQDCLSCFR